MYTVLLPPRVNPITVNKNISISCQSEYTKLFLHSFILLHGTIPDQEYEGFSLAEVYKLLILNQIKSLFLKQCPLRRQIQIVIVMS
jgi:hypothetical protein